MLDAVTIGSALVDIFVSSSDFELQKTDTGVFLCQSYGAKIEVDDFQLHTGGGAGNVAVGFARAGLSTATIAELGKDFWAFVVAQDLEKNHVSADLLIKEKREKTGGSVILVGGDGGRTIMVHRGASSLLDPQDIPERVFERTSIVHLSSVAGRVPTLRHIFNLTQKHQVMLSWNPGNAEMSLLASGEIEASDIPAQIFFCNKEEWSQVREVSDKLRAHIPEIIITDGKHGLTLLVQGEEKQFAGGPVTEVVDETGAGDGFAAGYVSARFYKKSPEEAVAWGMANARSVIEHMGAKDGLLEYSHLAELVTNPA